MAQQPKNKPLGGNVGVRTIAAIVMVIGVGTMVFSQSQAEQKKQVPAASFNPAPARNGKKYVATKEIIFDQASKTLRLPTADETQALVDQISGLTNRSTEGLSVTPLANGVKMSLEGRFANVVLGRARADGSIEIQCVTTLQEAIEFLGLEESTPQQ